MAEGGVKGMKIWETIVETFEIPEEARPFIEVYLTDTDVKAIELMGTGSYLPEDLFRLLKPIVEDPQAYTQDAYSRGIFNKTAELGEIGYKVGTFAKCITYLAQYDPEAWKKIPAEVREKIDVWYVNKYAEEAKPRLEESLRNPSKLIENAFFYTLEETLALIDRQEQEEFCVFPCNCKALALKCEGRKPSNVCLGFHYKSINSDYDRGHGKLITKEEAKALVRMANKNGLMQTTETEWGICNCCGCCCYPIRSSQQIGAKGLWPKKIYDIVWDEEACIRCGKCARICNFGAFTQDAEKRISFDREKCWGCTICMNNCPKGAISIVKAQ